MENKNQNPGVSSSNDGVVLPPTSDLGVGFEQSVAAGALSLNNPTGAAAAGADKGSSKSNILVRLVKRADVILAVLLVLSMIGVFVLTSTRNDKQQANTKSPGAQFGTQEVPLDGFVPTTDGIEFGASSVVVNGLTELNGGLVVSPSIQPSNPKTGQLYFDQETQLFAYYNGSEFITLGGTADDGASSISVSSIGDLSGDVGLGGGLSAVGNQLVNVGVLSVGGQSGSIALGDGLSVSGNTLQNSGVLNVIAGTDIAVTDDGNGNFTVSNVGAGTGTVTGSGGTTGTLPLFTSAQNIEDSIITQSGFTVTISGDLSVVTGGLSLSNALTVTNGGTGATSLAANGVVIGGGTSALSTVSSGGPGLCFLSTAGAPTFGACPSAGGVTSLNGLTGGVSVANASAAGSTVTIDDASTATKGIASFNATNFTAAAGAVNTIQNINTGASPIFAAVNTNSITPSGAFTLGAIAHNVTLQGAAVSIAATNGGTTNSLTFASPSGGNKTITIPNATGTVAVSASGPLALDAAGNLTCSTCLVTGGAVVSVDGLSGTLTIDNSSGVGSTITIDDATAVAKGIASFNSTNFSVASGAVNTAQNINTGATPTFAGVNANSLNPSAALTVGATGQTFTLQGDASSTTTATGGGFTTTVGFSGSPVGAVRYNFDRSPAANTYTICTTAGNCSGVGGGVTTPGGSLNRLAKFTAGQVVGDSTITDNGTAVTTTADLVIQGGDATLGVANTQTGTLNFAHSASGFLGSIVQGGLTDDQTYTLPDATGEVCLDSGNCLGGGGGGANTALSNLTGVAINTTLLPNAAGTINLGSGTFPFGELFLAGTSGTPGTNNFRITGASTGGTQVITLPDATGTVCLQSSTSCGFAPTTGSANYIQNQIASPQTADFSISGSGRAPTFNATTGINTGAGAGTQRIDASGNLVAIGNLTATGAITIGSSGAGNNVIINGTNILDVQDPTSLASTLDVTGTTTLSGDLAANGTNIALGNANTDLVTVTGIIQGGSPLVFEGGTADTNELTLAIAALTGDHTITLPDATGDVCLTSGNCVGVGGGVSTAGGTLGTLPVFSGTQAIGDSLVSQNTGTGTVIVNGHLSLATGNQFQINGTQISSANLSNDANLAKLGSSQTFTGATNAFQNGSNTTNAFNVQNASGNRILTVDTTGGQLILGQGSTVDGKLVFNNMTNGNTISFLVGTPGGNRNISLPDSTGTICLDSGNCAGAGATLQTSYNFSVGGTTPKIKLDSTLNGVDIQDADTTIGADLFDVRESNGAGLGQVMFGVGNTGQVTLQNGANSTTAFRLLTDGGTAVLTGDTSAGRVILGQGGTLAGSLIFQNASNSNQVTLTTAAATGPQTITLPDATGTVCLSSGNCLGGGGGGANTALSNLTGVAINTTLLPGAAGTINLGSGTLPFGDVFLAGTSGTPGTNNFRITGASTSGTRTITLPDESGTVCTSASGSTNCQGNFILNQSASNQTANFQISGTGRANTSILTPRVDVAAAGILSIGDTTATTITIGHASSAQTINLGFTSAATTVRIGDGDTNNKLIRIGTGDSVSNIINIGNGTSATNAITIGGTGGSTIRVGDTQAAGSISLGAGMTTGTINIGGASQTGTITIGGISAAQQIDLGTTTGASTIRIGYGDTNAKSILIGTGNSVANTITLGGTGANVIAIGNAQTGGSVSIGAAMTTGTTSIQGGSTSAAVSIQALASGRLNIGTNDAAADIWIGAKTLTTGTQTIDIGANNGGGGSTNVTIGSTGNATGGTTAIQAKGNINLLTNGVTRAVFDTTATGNLYLGNGTSNAAPSGFVIRGTDSSTTAVAGGALTIQGGAANTGTANGGGVNIFGGAPSGVAAAGTIQIGNTTGAVTQSINIGTNSTASSTNNVTIGSTVAGTTAVQGATTITNRASGSADTLIVSNSTSTGTIAIFRDNATAVATIADGGATTFQNQTNGSNAFRILNSNGDELAGVDSSSAIIRLFSGATGHVPSTTATTTITAREGGSTVIVNGYIYMLGGCDSSGTASAVVQYARISSSGTTGTWSTTTSLPNASCDNAAATYNGYIYVNGGGASDAISDDVYYAKVNSDGTITSWNTSATAVPFPRTAHAMAVYNGYLYAIGGYNGAFVGTRNVDYIKINSDGSTGTWTTVSNWLPAGATDGESATVANGYLYVFGDSDKNQIVYGQIANDGSISASATVDSDALSSSRYGGRIIALNGFLYVTGGRTVSGTISTATNIISYTSLGSDGSIGAWADDSSTLSGNRQSHGIATANGYMYVVGGHDGTDEVNTTLYTSGPRVKVNGALDLIGGGGESLSDGGTGGQLTAGDTNIVGTLGVTGNITAKGGLSVLNNLTVNVAANTSSAFAVMNAAGLTQFSIDTSNSRVYIGNPTADATGALLVLDNASGTDPTGVDGAMYYNTTMAAMRCYFDSRWQMCNEPRSLGWGYDIQEDFLAANFDDSRANDDGIQGMYRWLATLAGTTGDAFKNVSFDVDHPGIMTLETGTNAAGAATITMNNASEDFAVGGGEVMETAMYVETLATDASNDYDFRMGWCDVAAAQCTDGVYFEYDRGTSTNWSLVAANNGTRTRIQNSNAACSAGSGSSVAVAADTWVRLKWIATSSGHIDYYINGTFVGCITANINTTIARASVPAMHIIKSAGATNYQVQVDYYHLRRDLTTPR